MSAIHSYNMTVHKSSSTFKCHIEQRYFYYLQTTIRSIPQGPVLGLLLFHRCMNDLLLVNDLLTVDADL